MAKLSDTSELLAVTFTGNSVVELLKHATSYLEEHHEEVGNFGYYVGENISLGNNDSSLTLTLTFNVDAGNDPQEDTAEG